MKKNLRTFSIQAASAFCMVVLLTIVAIGSGAHEVFAQGSSSGYCSGVSSSQGLLQAGGSSTKFDDVVKYVVCFFQQFIIPFLFAVAIAVFIFGMVRFIATEDASEREKGRQFMLWGVIGLTVMFCVWGLVNILNSTFGVKTVFPQLPTN